MYNQEKLFSINSEYFALSLFVVLVENNFIFKKSFTLSLNAELIIKKPLIFNLWNSGLDKKQSTKLLLKPIFSAIWFLDNFFNIFKPTLLMYIIF